MRELLKSFFVTLLLFVALAVAISGFIWLGGFLFRAIGLWSLVPLNAPAFVWVWWWLYSTPRKAGVRVVEVGDDA
jgi:hypothetical protein